MQQEDLTDGAKWVAVLDYCPTVLRLAFICQLVNASQSWLGRRTYAPDNYSAPLGFARGSLPLCNDLGHVSRWQTYQHFGICDLRC